MRCCENVDFSRRSLLYEAPGGNLVDGLPPAASNAPGVEGVSLKANKCMARPVFKPDVLRILLSDFDAPLEEHSFDTKDKSCTSPMSVVITSAEHDCWTDFRA